MSDTSDKGELASRMRIPARGHAHADLLEEMRGYRAGDADWKDGRTWSLVYYAGEAHHEFLKAAHNMFFTENALNPIAFKSLKRMEAEVVQMAASMLNGPEGTVGTMTTGGTESILMAVKSARERARANKTWLREPELVLPTTAHVAFDKAAYYFGLTIRRVQVRPDLRVDPAAIKRAINRNTALVVASAPQYPHGVIDPIEEIGAICKAAHVPFHVDGCVGGFVLPWVELLGYPIQPFDFRVPGVTSMSADLHKYGFAAKGASLVLYRDMSYLKHQFFISTDWPGGIYASPSMTGTRAGGPIAAAWAALRAMGEDGFVEHTRAAMLAAKKLQHGIEAIPELMVLGRPDATIVAYSARERAVDIYAVADRLEDAGWAVDRQQKPASIHCTVTSNHAAVIDSYLEALRDAVAYVKSHPEVSSRGNAAMYGMMAKVPFRGMVKQGIQKVMEGMYAAGVTVPDPKNVGASGDGPLMKVMNKYGGTLNALLDKVDRVRGKE